MFPEYFTVFGLVMIPVGAIVTGLFADNIFDIITRDNEEGIGIWTYESV